MVDSETLTCRVLWCLAGSILRLYGKRKVSNGSQAIRQVFVEHEWLNGQSIFIYLSYF
jgi:hypothetical protein